MGISGRKRLRRFLITAALLFAALATALVALWAVHYHAPPATLSRAEAARALAFPRDEAAHLDAANEWWYYTGHLWAEDGTRYGFELVFFQSYLPEEARLGPLPLRWLNSPAYVAQFALTEETAGRFTFFERSNLLAFWRGGAEEGRFHVWLDDWRAEGGSGVHHLRAAEGAQALALDLFSQEPVPVRHGDDGLVAMGHGGYSYYTSYPRLVGRGMLRVQGRTLSVEALVWMDHQWGSWDWAAFQGWDWFSLQLEDGTALMLFCFREEGGEPPCQGTWIGPGGTARTLAAEEIALGVTARWTSPLSGAVYPAGWEVAVAGEGLRLTLVPTVPDQEVLSRWTPRYWEGSVRVQGERGGRPVSGVGYVELTGYR